MLRYTLILVLGLLAGCQSLSRQTRPASMEMITKQGHWRLEGVQSTTLELVGWQVRITNSRVNVSPKVPLLETLELEIVNSSPDTPLVLEPTEISIGGIANHPVLLGPKKTVVLNRGECHRFFYSPGRRADLLPYPFVLNITVFRGLNFKNPQTAKIVMY
ncbi:MAG: hypothetical protein SVT52_01665 [Planctomycetota bacterium]|nr:hypothetical protein [Planctomycetota bacterium]